LTRAADGSGAAGGRRGPRPRRAAVYAPVGLDRHERQIAPDRNIALPARAREDGLELGVSRVGDVIEDEAVEVPLDGELAVLAEGQIGVGVVQAARAAAGVEHALRLMQAFDQGHVFDRLAGIVLARLEAFAGIGLVAGGRGSAAPPCPRQGLARGHGCKLRGRAELGNRLVRQLGAERSRQRERSASDEQSADGAGNHFAGLPKSPFMRSISMRWSVSTLVAKSAMLGSSPLPGWARKSATICSAPVWC